MTSDETTGTTKMITNTEFENLIENKYIELVRVVAAPKENSWCIDAILRRSVQPEYAASLIASESNKNSVEIRRFKRLDSAAAYLHSVGIKSFIVDQKDAAAVRAAPRQASKNPKVDTEETQLML